MNLFNLFCSVTVSQTSGINDPYLNSILEFKDFNIGLINFNMYSLYIMHKDYIIFLQDLLNESMKVPSYTLVQLFSSI